MFVPQYSQLLTIMANYIRFDWAMKLMLRDKANHAVLEGLMTALLGEKFTIVKFLEHEDDKKDDVDKYNRIDILAESDRGELIIAATGLSAEEIEAL